MEVKLLRRHEEIEHSAFQLSKFNLQVDPWGVDKQQSHLSLPSWAFTDAAEQRHLAAMKVVLGRDLEMLEQKTITFSDGRTIKVTEAFPDVYGDFRLLRFLRKDKVQDPVTAAVRFRNFLQWREDNHVDEIRLQIEERLRRGDRSPGWGGGSEGAIGARAEVSDRLLRAVPVRVDRTDRRRGIGTRFRSDRRARSLDRPSGRRVVG